MITALPKQNCVGPDKTNFKIAIIQPISECVYDVKVICKANQIVAVEIKFNQNTIIVEIPQNSLDGLAQLQLNTRSHCGSYNHKIVCWSVTIEDGKSHFFVGKVLINNNVIVHRIPLFEIQMHDKHFNQLELQVA